MPERKEELRADALTQPQVAAAVDELDHRHERGERNAESQQRGRGVRSGRSDQVTASPAAIQGHSHEEIRQRHVGAVGHRRRKAAERVREGNQADRPYGSTAPAGHSGGQPEEGRVKRGGVRHLPEEAHGQRTG